MADDSIIYNRLKKNHKKLSKFLKSEGIEAFRLYEKDIPEYPYIVDIYKDFALVYEKGKKLDYSDNSQLNLHHKHKDQMLKAITDLLEIPFEKIILKSRLVQKGKDQYEKIEKSNRFFIVKENQMKFKVNLFDYLDSGLFLDHRPLRKLLSSETNQKSVLNLFAYTGSLSVASAVGGSTVTTVDMSHTYLEWAKDNFNINKISLNDHKFIQADALKYIDSLKENFDIILLDPPSFSNSKRMETDFNVQDGHLGLINKLMNHLSHDGTLYFSNNFTKFKLSSVLEDAFHIKEITFKTIPIDFRNKKIHRCFEIKHK